jgi:hypothetical protein
MSRRACLVGIASSLLLMAGCTQIHQVPPSRHADASPSASPAAAPTGGQAVVAIPTVQTLFGPPLSDAEIQPGTLKLKRQIAPHRRLKVTALPSSLRTVALGLRETARGKQRWGEVMIPEERKVFLRFAQDPSLGDWLIMITDVDVRDGPDAVPIVAYRWARDDVETYAACGIPQSITIDRCTDTFFQAPDYLFLHAGGEGGK